jgi:SAM-dependent methyltransferase
MIERQKQIAWYDNDGGFFGEGYIRGDDSIEGYLPGKNESLNERTQREVEGVIKLLGLKGGESIIDVPCGYGRHSIELAKRGYKVKGYDINKMHLKEASITALSNISVFSNLNDCSYNIPNYSCIDMLDLNKLESGYADAIINLFYSFGFFKTDKENESVMRGFYNQLKEGGKLLLHTDVSPEMILQGGNYKLSELRNLKNGGQLKIEEKYDQLSKRINGKWTIYDLNGGVNSLTPYSVRIYSAQEFKDMIVRCGFSQVEIYGSFNKDNFTSKSNEMIVVAKK